MQTATDTLRATQNASLDKQRLMPLADNAFRLLGLSCQASQKEIYASASALRRAFKLGVEKTPAHDISWLGVPERTENGLRDALSRLTVPAQRIYERLFWFFDPQAAATAALSFASPQHSAARLQSIESASARHDLALLSLAAMLRLDPSLKLADDWRIAYTLWKEVIESKEFWSLLMAADLKGDFEQVTTFGEITDLRGRAWQLVTSPVAEIAKDAILREDHAEASRALAVLHDAGLPQTLADEYEQEILGPVEDKFDLLMYSAFSIFRYEVKSNQSVGERRETCWRAHAKFNEEVRPALKQILELAGAHREIARRAFAAAADVLVELADGFESGFDNESKLKMLRKAWQIAPPGSASLLLIEEHLAAAGDMSERQAKTDSGYARQLSLALREPMAQPELFTAYVRKEQVEKDLERWGKGASKFIFFVVFALLVGKCFNSMPRSRTTIYPGMNLNVPMARFTPPPMPELTRSAIVGSVTASELQVMLEAKTVTLLHVGAKGEYETGHIPGALWMPEAELAARAKRLPKNRSLVVYCYCDAEEASRRVAFDLRMRGFQVASVLEGGYRAWLDAGLPVKPPRRGSVQYGSKN